MEELVHQRIRGRDLPQLFHVRMDHKAGEIIQIDLAFPAGHFHITEAVEGKVLSYDPLLAIGDIGEFRLRGTKVLVVEIAVLKDLPELEEQLCPLRRAALKGKQVLSMGPKRSF